jgi:hypothetical protein
MQARVAVILLLVVAAFFVASPWLQCALVPMFVARRFIADAARVCTFGDPVTFPAGYGLPGFAGPYWGYLLVGLIYVMAALWIGGRKRAP